MESAWSALRGKKPRGDGGSGVRRPSELVNQAGGGNRTRIISLEG